MMLNGLKKDMLLWILLLSSGALFFLGGLGVSVSSINLFGILIASVLIIITSLYLRKITLPGGVIFYLFFIITLSLSIFWSFDKTTSFSYLSLFIAGGIFWIIFFNLEKILKKLLYMEIILGLVFALFYFSQAISGKIYIRSLSLVMPSVETLQHHHLGDYWVIVILASIGLLLSEKRTLLKGILIATLVLGFYILAISYSRSAYVSLAAGGTYLLENLLKRRNLKNFLILGSVVLILFLRVGGFKSTLFSRGYFFQAAAGAVAHPLGVGLGNFSIISSNPRFQVLGFSDVSDFTHNVFLEIISGIGIFSIFFFIWLFFVGKDIFWGKKKLNEVNITGAISLALLVNFFFDYTYFIPTMLWLWFVHLGIAQRYRILMR